MIAPVFAGLHQRLAPYYSSTGRPSIDPELMIRMLLTGYCHGIRSERRLCEEVALNLAYRWFCRLDLNDAVPDQSSFSKKPPWALPRQRPAAASAMTKSSYQHAMLK